MTGRRRNDSAHEHREVGGHIVRYRKTGGREEVTIDGELMPFIRVGTKYQLVCTASQEPHESLLDAAEAFATTLPPTRI